MRFASIKAVIERSAQISLMSRIYKLATRAIIYVGEEDRNSRMVIHYMKNKAKMDEVAITDLANSISLLLLPHYSKLRLYAVP